MRVALFSADEILISEISPLLLGKGCEIIPVDTSLSSSDLRAANFHLCIIDLAEPAVSGQLLLRRFPPEVPVIAVINDPLREFEFAGIFDVLTRPLELKRLSENIDYLQNSSHTADAPPPPPTEAELELFSEFISCHCGLHFDRRNRKTLERGILNRMKVVAARSVIDYYSYLVKHQESRLEGKKLISLLTIGETSFFRFDPHFSALIQNVIPELIRENHSTKELRIWSAGCSTGEEVYSLAITILHYFPQIADWKISILGTDISPHSLETARQGVYQKRTLRHVPPEILSAWFTETDRGWMVSERLRRIVQFSYLNLQSETYPNPKEGTAGCDVVFCRNVMIYFRPETVRAVVSRLRRALRPGGYLFLGHAETLGSAFLDFIRCQHQGGIFYRAGEMPTETAPAGSQKTAAKNNLIKPQFILFEGSNNNSKLCDKSHDLSKEKSGIFSSNKVNNKTSSQISEGKKESSSNSVDEILDQGFALAGSGKLDDAYNCCRRVLQSDDLCARGYFLRGLIYDQKGELNAAAEDFQRVILLDLKAVLAHYHLAHIYRRCGRRADAIRSLQTAIRLLTKCPETDKIADAGEWTVSGLKERCSTELKQMEKQS